MSLQGTFKQGDTPLLENRTFVFSAFMSAALRLLSLLLYQSAIQLAPLSSTVPYLSLSPAMLLVTAYLLIGEQPSWPGLVGVVIVTLGGYLLAFMSASPNPKKSDARTPNEKVAPVTEQDDSVMSLEMGSKLLIMSDPGAKKGIAGVVVRFTDSALGIHESCEASCYALNADYGSLFQYRISCREVRLLLPACGCALSVNPCY